MNNKVTIWYRYEDNRMNCFGMDGDYTGPNGMCVELRRIPVRGATPKGVWLFHKNRQYGGKWISNTSRRRYAYPTKELAWESFQIRKNRQAGYLRNDLDKVTAVLALVSRQGESPPADNLVYHHIEPMGAAE